MAASGRHAFDTNTFTVCNQDIKSQPLFGLGVGYKRNHWLRFDLTGDYAVTRHSLRWIVHQMPAHLHRLSRTSTPPTSRAGSVSPTPIGTSANWCGFTPFVGAGIGFAALTVDGLKRRQRADATAVAFGASNTTTNFAWALHAGVSYDVSPQFAVDLAYRYADLGTAKSGAVTDYLGVAHPNATLHIKDITSNDLMLGFRYKFQREEPVGYAMK